MKKAIKKLMAALLAVAMLCAMAVPAFAADNATKTTIKINGTGKSYEAYRILNVTNDGSDKYAYTFNTKYEDIVKAATGKDTLSDVLNVISGYTANGTEIDAFAKRVWNAIKSNSSISADVTTDNKEFTNVDQGYYLIVEKAIADHDDSEVDDTYSLLMLSTAGKNTITVEAKENSPELTKKVKEKNDSTNYTSDWQDAADYDIGDDVHFMLTGTVSEKYDSYETYKYVFHDKMSSGLQLNADSFVVKVDDVVVSGYKVNTTALKDGCTFEVAFDDLKKVLEKAVTPNSKITVEYTAKLTGDGVKYGSEGNPNEARLEFANNPYGDGTGYTPWDKVTVFTYKLVANKVDNNNQPLEGAGFTLYKKDNNDSWNAVDTEVTPDTAELSIHRDGHNYLAKFSDKTPGTSA